MYNIVVTDFGGLSSSIQLQGIYFLILATLIWFHFVFYNINLNKC